ncbi:MAG: hypothetical protein OEZ36_12225, partial [Spirochaetota bacterium]|nr:hypothetical protein [Spirochaetota bacterium]
VRCRGIGNEIIVDMEILVEPTLSLYQAHDISENVKCNIYENIKIIREVIVHVEPYDSHNLYSTSERVSLVNEIHRLVCHHEEVEHINSIRFHYIPGGLEANLDIVVQPDITVKQGHDISDSLETELQTIPSIVLVHIHLEYHKKFIQ